jgi:hypothetical protein
LLGANSGAATARTCWKMARGRTQRWGWFLGGRSGLGRSASSYWDEHPLFCYRGCCNGRCWCEHPLCWCRGFDDWETGRFWRWWGWCWLGALGGSLKYLGDLDVGVGNVGSVCERWDRVGYLVLDESEHVSGGLAQVIVGGDFWERNCVWEPIDGECVANAGGAGDVAFVATVVFF